MWAPGFARRDRAMIAQLINDWAEGSFTCALTRSHKVPEGLDHRLQPGGLTFKFRNVILGQAPDFAVAPVLVPPKP